MNKEEIIAALDKVLGEISISSMVGFDEIKHACSEAKKFIEGIDDMEKNLDFKPKYYAQAYDLAKANRYIKNLELDNRDLRRKNKQLNTIIDSVRLLTKE